MMWDSALLCAGLSSTALARGYLSASDWLSTSLGAIIHASMNSPTIGKRYSNMIDSYIGLDA